MCNNDIVEKLDAELGPTPRYVDPVLDKNRRKYVQFIRRPMRGESIDFTASPTALAGLFFVRKKNGKLRIVWDCRDRFDCTPVARSDRTTVFPGASKNTCEIFADNIITR